MPQEVEIISRTSLPSPTLDKPERQIYQIQYRAGELPPHFVYIDKEEWTPTKEKELIKADIEKRMKSKRETISI